MDLYLLRHGPAVERGSARYREEAERPLTIEGRDKVLRIARGLRALELDFDLILTSPYVRARETAELVARQIESGQPIELCEHLAIAGDPRQLIQELSERRPAPDRALLVGHEPHLSCLASHLLTGGPQLDLVLKKGGLCKLSVTKLRLGRCAVLEALLTPKQMLLMA